MAGEETVTSFDSIAQIAKEQKVALEAEREELQTQLTANGDKLRALNSILKALDPESKPTRGSNGHRARSRQSEYTPKEDRKAALIEWLNGRQGDITHSIVQHQFGWSSWHTGQMINWARDAGLLRLSATQGNLKIYRSLVGEEA